LTRSQLPLPPEFDIWIEIGGSRSSISHIVVATGSRLVFVAGQVAEDSQGNLIANNRREHLAMIEEGRIASFGDHKSTDTLVGVAALSRPDYLLEVDAIAVLDNGT
jgi:enamine deaminase RidA (YjgF/YER057c/UK114 family)